jgi:hypothetical protein
LFRIQGLVEPWSGQVDAPLQPARVGRSAFMRVAGRSDIQFASAIARWQVKQQSKILKVQRICEHWNCQALYLIKKKMHCTFLGINHSILNANDILCIGVMVYFKYRIPSVSYSG